MDMSGFDNAVTVGYWRYFTCLILSFTFSFTCSSIFPSIRGLAAPLRMMAMFGGAKLLAENYDLKPKEGGGFDSSSWKDAKTALRKKNPLMNLPYLIDGDVVVSQTNACFAYLGRKLGLFGSNEAEASQCEQLLCEIYDLRGAMVRFAYSPLSDEEAKEAAAKMCESVSNPFSGQLPKLEEWLSGEKANGKSGNFLVGDKASAPDFHLYEMLYQFDTMTKFYELPSLLANFPNLKNFLNSFGSMPQNSKYLSSNLAKLPFNNKAACFGAHPSGGRWKEEYSSTYEFGSYSGEY